MRGRWANSRLRERLGHTLRRTRAWTHRATGSGLGLRAVVWGTGTVALILGTPGGWRLLPVWLLAGLLALGAAAAPNSAWVSVLLAAPVVLLAFGALTVGYDPPLGQVALLAAMMYMHHSSAALAAHLRTDSVEPTEVLLRWARHAAMVLLASALLAVVMVSLAARAPVAPVTAYLLLGGVGAVAVVATLAYLRHRRISR